jgi:hypothetical protein
MGFFSVLTLLLLIFKVLGYLAISWWLVFTPIAVGVVLAFVLLLVAAIVEVLK